MINCSVDFLPTMPVPIEASSDSESDASASTANERFANSQDHTPAWCWDKAADRTVKPSAPVSLQPFTRLDSWRIYRVYFSDGSSSSHLVGTSRDEVRVTSAVNSVYPMTDHAVTATGRVYLLGRELGSNGHAEHLFRVWLKNMGAIKVINQTSEFLSMQMAGKIGRQGERKLRVLPPAEDLHSAFLNRTQRKKTQAKQPVAHH